MLKVPHHGSGDADPEFLAASGARVALISVGADNTYGHPTRRLLTWLARAGMRVHRTDREGDLAVVGIGGAWGVAARGRRRRSGARGRPWRRSDGRGVSVPRDTMQACRPTPVEPTSRLRVVIGEEELLRARAVTAVRTAVFAHHEDPRCTSSRPRDWPMGELADVLAPSLFGGHRLVVVTGVQEAAGALNDVAHRLRQGTRSRAHAGAGPQRRQAERGPGEGLQAGRRRRRRVPQAEVGRRPGELRAQRGPHVRRPDHRRRRQRRRRVDRQRPASAVAAAGQLVSDFGGTIDADAVARFYRGQAEVTGFDVAERALVGDRERSVEKLRWALQRGVAHVLIADAIADSVRTAARVASLEHVRPGELARILKLPPWKVKKGLAHARGWSIDGLQQAIGVTAELNADVKGAAASADYALERAVRRIVTIRAETGRGSRAPAGR